MRMIYNIAHKLYLESKSNKSGIAVIEFPKRLRMHKRTLRKHVYSSILRLLPPKDENFQIKNSGSFHISAQNIDCGYLLEPPR